MKIMSIKQKNGHFKSERFERMQRITNNERREENDAG